MSHKLSAPLPKPNEIQNFPPAIYTKNVSDTLWRVFEVAFNRMNTFYAYCTRKEQTFDPEKYSLIDLRVDLTIFQKYVQDEYTPRFQFTEKIVKNIQASSSLRKPLHLLYSLSIMEKRIIDWQTYHKISDITLPGKVDSLYEILFAKHSNKPLLPLPFPRNWALKSYFFPLLKNASGTDCFMNAAVQLVFSNPSLVDYIVFGEGQYEEVINTLFDYQYKAWKESQSPIDLATRLRNLYPNFADGEQHDTAEVIMELIKPLSQRNPLFHTTIITTFYSDFNPDEIQAEFTQEKGRVASQTQAVLTLEVVQEVPFITLEDLLDTSFNQVIQDPTPVEFSTVDLQSSVKLTPTYVTTRFESAPEMLIINFKRTGHDRTSGALFKIHNLVGLQKFFYLSGELVLTGKGAKYRLESFNTHFGSGPYEGHYVHYRDTPEGYFYLGDDQKRKVDEFEFLNAAQNCYVCVLSRESTAISESELQRGKVENSHRLLIAIYKMIVHAALQGDTSYFSNEINQPLKGFVKGIVYSKDVKNSFEQLSQDFRQLLLETWTQANTIQNIRYDLLVMGQNDLLSIPLPHNQEKYDSEGYLLTLMVDRLVKRIEKKPSEFFGDERKLHMQILHVIAEISSKKSKWALVTETIAEEILQFFVSGTISYYKKDISPLKDQVFSSATRCVTKHFDPEGKNTTVQHISQFVFPLIKLIQTYNKREKKKEDYAPLIELGVRNFLQFFRFSSMLSEACASLISASYTQSGRPLISGAFNISTSLLAPFVQGEIDPRVPRSSFAR